MDRSRLLPRVCFYASVGLALLGVLLRTVAFLTCFDRQIGYFNDGIIPTLSNSLFGIAAAVAILPAVLTPKEAVATTLRTPAYRFPTLIMGVILAAFTVMALILCAPLTKGDLLLAPIFLSLPASAYYLLVGLTSAVQQDGRAPDWLVAIGFLPILWSLSALAETYTDRYVAMNSPVKLGLHLALIGYLLILITELRYRLGKPMPRVALCFLSVGAVFALAGSLPVLIATGAKALADVPHTLYAAVLTAGGLYGLYLLACLVRTPQNTANATVAEPRKTVPQPDDENA